MRGYTVQDTYTILDIISLQQHRLLMDHTQLWIGLVKGHRPRMILRGVVPPISPTTSPAVVTATVPGTPGKCTPRKHRWVCPVGVATLLNVTRSLFSELLSLKTVEINQQSWSQW